MGNLIFIILLIILIIIIFLYCIIKLRENKSNVKDNQYISNYFKKNNILNAKYNQDIEYIYIKKKYQKNYKIKNIKILNLILYSEDNIYNEMRKIILKYLKNTKISFYFYCYKNDLIENYYIDENEHIIYIKGIESFIPGCLDKTLKVFEIFENSNYDYIVRTNISTIINFKILEYELNNDTIDYGGPYIINWYDTEKIDIPKEHRNINYISGTCIILSKKIIQLLIRNKELINNYNVVDDIAIGSFLSKHNIQLKTINYVINSNDIIEDCICYRNKHENNRNIDIESMKNITDSIIFQFY